MHIKNKHRIVIIAVHAVNISDDLILNIFFRLQENLLYKPFFVVVDCSNLFVWTEHGTISIVSLNWVSVHKWNKEPTFPHTQPDI